MFPTIRPKILIAIGLVLFLAAGMKAIGREVEPVARTGIFSLQLVQLLVISSEIALAVWLVSGLLESMAWMTAVVVFVGFAGVAFYQGWIGQASCGCLGKVKVSPWITLSFDLSILAALGMVCPHGEFFRADWNRFRAAIAARLLLGAGLVGLVLMSLAGFGHLYFGSVESAYAALKGEPVTIEPFLVNVGTCRNAERKEFTLRVVNHTSNPVRIVGQLPDCACELLTELPVEIPGHGAVELAGAFTVVNKQGLFASNQTIYMDGQNELGFLRFRISGHAIRATK
ncbi:MAG: hypothetical protein HYX68_26745 [Planctomycetes bacterium]|nr:hypothetical protein [Planctomycetota bacterium]